MEASDPVKFAEQELDELRELRRSDPEAAAEALAAAVRQRAEALGADVHPALGLLWLEYGDTLLEIVERGGLDAPCEVVQTQEQAEPATVSEGTDEDEDDVEGDLQLAWECLEIARQCLERQDEVSESVAALGHCHGRLAELLMLQERFDEAVQESRTALDLCCKAQDEASAEDQDGALEAARSRLANALCRQKLHQEQLQQECLQALTSSSTNGGQRQPQNDLSGLVLESSIGFNRQLPADQEIVQVPVRKRPRTNVKER
eukprot:TRINITY_DN24683_c0_g2_i1.p1 TRINITY_DN24683_c0_g2~~TRINITY_DN24683_c0_g2_i1.p1  ORF type:complete len:273 (+),score=87.05 TRINITY_DN24683_c0_g2_i1:38-820(+)